MEVTSSGDHEGADSIAGGRRDGQDSLIKRYAFKLAVSLLSWPMNFCVQLMVSRGLGPVGFGSYSYLSSFFTNVLGFWDSGSSLGFYAKLCARPREAGLKAFYWLFAMIVAAGTFALIILAMGLGFRERLWPGQPPAWIFMAAVFAAATWFVSLGEKVVDAHALTVKGEPTRLAVKFIGTIAIASLFLLGRLGVSSFLGCQIGLLVLQLFLWSVVLRKNGSFLVARWRLLSGEFSRYAREFWDYSHPLITYSMVSVSGALADRWLLQYYGGGEEQGFYGLALQVGAFCFLFSSAMVPLLAREFSEAHATDNLPRMSAAFRSQLPRFYSLAAFGGVFLALQADHVAVLVGGNKFAGAALPMALVCLYPIHQTYGQLSGAVFYATGRTSIYRNIGITNTVLGLLVSYLLLAPSTIGGAGLGSAGMAYKMVAVQVVGINIQLWYNCRWLKVSFGWLLGHQVLVLAVFGLAAVGARAVGRLAGPTAVGELTASGIVYGLLAATVCWLSPGLFGVSRENIVWTGKHLAEFAGMRWKSTPG